MRLQVLGERFTSRCNSVKTFIFRNSFSHENVKMIGSNMKYLDKCSETISSFKRSSLTTLSLFFPLIVRPSKPAVPYTKVNA